MPRHFPLLLVALGTLGCGAEPPSSAAPVPVGATEAVVKPMAFQPAACGGVIGSVTWTGAIPAVPPVTDVRPRADGTGHDVRTFAHPYAPVIDRATFALRGAVVYLRSVDQARAKPWDLAPVRVEFREAQIVVSQGDRAPGRVGFARPGAQVSFRSSDPVFNVLRGRGAAFFALPFPEPEKPLERTFDSPGRVALTSAAGFSWQAADVFVCEHPYFAVSGADGRFEFTQVPEGTYDLIVWHPNWNTTAHERNPETGLIQRVVYAPPLEAARPVTVVPGRSTFAPMNLSLPK